jgi:hypothetical protein
MKGQSKDIDQTEERLGSPQLHPWAQHCYPDSPLGPAGLTFPLGTATGEGTGGDITISPQV